MRFQKKLFYGIIDRRKEYKREMEKTNRKYQAYIQILKEELHPAMGCTEPIALAYAAAVARRELGCLPDRVVIGASGSIIKNVKSVIVPNTNHLKGIPAAVSAGISSIISFNSLISNFEVTRSIFTICLLIFL